MRRRLHDLSRTVPEVYRRRRGLKADDRLDEILQAALPPSLRGHCVILGLEPAASGAMTLTLGISQDAIAGFEYQIPEILHKINRHSGYLRIGSLRCRISRTPGGSASGDAVPASLKRHRPG